MRAILLNLLARRVASDCAPFFRTHRCAAVTALDCDFRSRAACPAGAALSKLSADASEPPAVSVEMLRPGRSSRDEGWRGGQAALAILRPASLKETRRWRPSSQSARRTH